MGERAFGNLHEQSTIFLAAVWLHALFVDATTATTLSWAWLGFRFAYVAIWALTAGNIMPAILLATMPMYGIIIWLFATVRAMRSRCQLLSLSLSLSLVRSLTQRGLHGVKRRRLLDAGLRRQGVGNGLERHGLLRRHTAVLHLLQPSAARLLAAHQGDVLRRCQGQVQVMIVLTKAVWCL